jgi:ADP-ribose pyrophosphatase YjhB (NUDIX family)
VNGPPPARQNNELMYNEAMNEYILENGHDIDTSKLQTGFVADDEFSVAHRTMTFACHDVLVRMNGKYLLVNRDNVPAKDILWPLGGRVVRGKSAEGSLAEKVRKEAGLELQNIQFLGVARTMFETDPWDHGKGTDTLNLMYVADGVGDVALDKLHSEPTWVTEDEYRSTLRATLHPYVVEMMDKALQV